jgi:hypothetical protein
MTGPTPVEVSRKARIEPESLVSVGRDSWFDLQVVVGVAAIVFSAIYLTSDLMEAVQGNFSTFRLSLTYVGEAAIPFFVLGLYAVQRPRIGRLGLFGAVAFAYSYVFFESTVVYALTAKTANWAALGKVFGPWMTIHGLIMLAGGLSFGLAIVRAGLLPRWTGLCLMAGVVLIVAASGLSNIPRTVAEAVNASAFVGMGIALVRGHSGSTAPNIPVAHECLIRSKSEDVPVPLV